MANEHAKTEAIFLVDDIASYKYSFIFLVIVQLAGGRGQLQCMICRKQVTLPEDGFPICYVSDYIRDQINNQALGSEGRY